MIWDVNNERVKEVGLVTILNRVVDYFVFISVTLFI